MIRVLIQGLGWTAVIEVDPQFGDAAGVARRLRAMGLAARVRAGEVLVNANA